MRPMTCVSWRADTQVQNDAVFAHLWDMRKMCMGHGKGSVAFKWMRRNMKGRLAKGHMDQE